jgi:hypothetical protein
VGPALCTLSAAANLTHQRNSSRRDLVWNLYKRNAAAVWN